MLSSKLNKVRDDELAEDLHHRKRIAPFCIEFKIHFIHQVPDEVQAGAAFFHLVDGEVHIVFLYNFRIKSLALIMHCNFKLAG